MNNDHTSGNCWVLDDKKQCASNEEIRNFLGNVTRMQIRAEYWYGGDTSFLDDVIIKKPDS